MEAIDTFKAAIEAGAYEPAQPGYAQRAIVALCDLLSTGASPATAIDTGEGARIEYSAADADNADADAQGGGD